MKLTSYTDFGLRALIYLATLPEGELSSVAKVSAMYDVSRNHMVKVVNQLVKLGYLQSQRGKHGGIRLACAPATINIGQVIRGLEGNLDGIDCHAPTCHIVSVCLLKGALKQAMAAFLTVMDGYTLQDLLANRSELQQVFGAVIPTLSLEPDEQDC
ncbi:Rrf2 family transcriptional regulator [Aeromonas cavernicola]|uniref:Transcriptional regulator n=1 Tax=Aeromonas cavernicola TaxID=1006623 RepID=A0A2H9U4Z6_9GAMM|nr:Rrf2 family transcriptional regulator [Aeromonas cavernicola]PJG59126.1 transcriptional regulator [Aeromonas cavernicola]